MIIERGTNQIPISPTFISSTLTSSSVALGSEIIGPLHTTTLHHHHHRHQFILILLINFLIIGFSCLISKASHAKLTRPCSVVFDSAGCVVAALAARRAADPNLIFDQGYRFSSDQSSSSTLLLLFLLGIEIFLLTTEFEITSPKSRTELGSQVHGTANKSLLVISKYYATHLFTIRRVTKCQSNTPKPWSSSKDRICGLLPRGAAKAPVSDRDATRWSRGSQRTTIGNLIGTHHHS